MLAFYRLIRALHGRGTEPYDAPHENKPDPCNKLQMLYLVYFTVQSLI